MAEFVAECANSVTTRQNDGSDTEIDNFCDKRSIFRGKQHCTCGCTASCLREGTTPKIGFAIATR